MIVHMNNHLTLRQLRALLAVEQAGSMTGAAQALHLTPAALSMLIKSLEESLGTKMFERTTRRMVLTSAGELLVPSVQQALNQIDSAVEALQVIPNKLGQSKQQLIVATSPLMAFSVLPAAISAFKAKYPDTRITLLDAAVESLVSLVSDGRADVAICTAPEDVDHLHVTHLYSDRLMLVCQPNNPLAKLAQVPWQMLVDQPLIVMRPGSGLRGLVDQALSKWPRRSPPAFEVSHVASAVGLVQAGQGVAALPSNAISRANDLQPIQGLISIPLTAPIVKRKIVALARQDNYKQPIVRDFTRFFKNWQALSA